MALTGKSLADGQVASSWGAIFTASGETVVKSIDLYNTTGSSVSVDLAVTRSGGTRRQVAKLAIDANTGQSFLGGGAMLLSNGDAIEAQDGTGGQVDYLITGAS